MLLVLNNVHVQGNEAIGQVSFIHTYQSEVNLLYVN